MSARSFFYANLGFLAVSLVINIDQLHNVVTRKKHISPFLQFQFYIDAEGSSGWMAISKPFTSANNLNWSGNFTRKSSPHRPQPILTKLCCPAFIALGLHHLRLCADEEWMTQNIPVDSLSYLYKIFWHERTNSTSKI